MKVPITENHVNNHSKAWEPILKRIKAIKAHYKITLNGGKSTKTKGDTNPWDGRPPFEGRYFIL